MKPIAEGHIEYPYDERCRKSDFEARLTMTDTKEEVFATFYRRKLHPKYRKRHQKQIAGRYCAVSKSGTVHICECRKTNEERQAERAWWKGWAEDMEKIQKACSAK